jgi:type II secretory pathway pseudopilin PulG
LAAALAGFSASGRRRLVDGRRMETTLPVPSPSRAFQRGFTLAEGIVLVSVVLLLTGIAVPMFGNYLEDGRRAQAEADCRSVAAALLCFHKDLGVHPARSGAGTDNTCQVLFTGSVRPASNPWNANHAWITAGMSATLGDLLDHHLLANAPQGSKSGAYATTGSVLWRGPYLKVGSPIDPWGRPYVINVVAGYRSHPTNFKRLWVVSAGPNGVFDTNPNATATTELSGDDIGVLVSQQP